MDTKSPTPILLDTKILSRLIGDVLDLAGVPASKKSACLNKAAARIAGPKHNWGFLTNHDTPVVAHGLTGYTVAEAEPVKSEVPALSPAASGPSHDLKNLKKMLRYILESSLNMIVLTTDPGSDLYTPIAEVAQQAGRRAYYIRTSMLSGNEVLEHDNTLRLKDRFQPHIDVGGVTVYMDADGFSDEGLKALAHEHNRLKANHPSTKIILITRFSDSLASRLRTLAPDLLARAFWHHIDTPIPEPLAEFLSAKMSDTGLDKDLQSPSFPTLEGWKKAGEIMKKAQQDLEDRTSEK
jgi:hypothetical protein